MSKPELNTNIELKLAKHLQQLREEKGLSQESLGLQLQKGQSDIAKIESGKKRITVIDLLNWAQVLGISIDRLNGIISDLYLNSENKKTFWDNK
tara:strand:+ start:5146 stop:5427 length:282 start_codon:yes stop_codon:yes gene_type:complete